jgi:hypothetical protein
LRVAQHNCAYQTREFAGRERFEGGSSSAGPAAHQGGWATLTVATASPSDWSDVMWIFPLSITLDMKKTRTSWHVRFRVFIML